MTQPVVSDAGPIISFARADELGLLRALLPSILIPEGVYDEVAHGGAGRPGAEAVTDTTWIRSQAVNPHHLATVSSTLDRAVARSPVTAITKPLLHCAKKFC